MPSSIYPPSEDSFFLLEFVKREVKKYDKVLDMGSGSGAQSELCLKQGINPENLTLIDINKTAVKALKKKFPESNAVHSDLFKNVKGKFDLIIFNPPYLPENKFDKKSDTTGGKRGSEVINKFLRQAKKHLNKNGKILLLTSSFTKKVNFLDYKKSLLGTKKLFFEELYVWKLTIKEQ